MPGRVPRVIKTECVVLSHRRLGEADRIVTLLTPRRGKVDAVAKGALRTRSKLAGHLEPLLRVEVVLAHGRNLDLVTQAQVAEAFPAVHRDLDRLTAAMYLAELADRFTVEHLEADDVYALLLAALLRLERGDGAQLVTRTFELGLLTSTGFRPQWSECTGCGEAVPAEAGVTWSALEGGVVCARCRPQREGLAIVDPAVLKVLRAYQALPYEEAARIRLTPALASGLERVMHTLMQSVAERELRTAQFVAAVRRTTLTSVEDASESADGGAARTIVTE